MLSAILALWSVPLAGCVLFPTGPPSRNPDIVGLITRVDLDRTPPRILVEEKPGVWDQPAAGDKMYLTVTGGTSIFVQQTDGSIRGGGREDLRVGASVRAWHTGRGLDSWPMQVEAADIVIIESAR